MEYIKIIPKPVLIGLSIIVVLLLITSYSWGKNNGMEKCRTL